MTAPLRCVVDTNVPMTANRRNDAASQACVASSARALHALMVQGHLFIDNDRAIVGEYRGNLSAVGEPGPGDAFLKWVLTNEWSGMRVTRVVITPRNGAVDEFEELPDPPAGVQYDPSDRKFLAVSAAHTEKPPILQSFDSKWWGWRDVRDFSIHFLCPTEIEQKYLEKIGS